MRTSLSLQPYRTALMPAVSMLCLARFPFLSKHRIPADMLYLSAPRPPQQYRELAASGAKWMNLLAVGVGADANKSTVDAYVEETTGVLEPAVSSLTKLGLLNRSYVCESR